MAKSEKVIALEKEIAAIKKTIAYSEDELERIGKEIEQAD